MKYIVKIIKIINSKFREFTREEIDLEYKNLNTKTIFTRIYKNKIWGKSNEFEYFSGDGSHLDHHIKNYIKIVNKFLKELPFKPVLVDLGCGDFYIGSKFVDNCKCIIACDIVP